MKETKLSKALWSRSKHKVTLCTRPKTKKITFLCKPNQKKGVDWNNLPIRKSTLREFAKIDKMCLDAMPILQKKAAYKHALDVFKQEIIKQNIIVIVIAKDIYVRNMEDAEQKAKKRLGV